MASNYTCRACSRALSRHLPPSALQASRSPCKAQSLHRVRNLSTTAPSLYHATFVLSEASQPTWIAEEVQKEAYKGRKSLMLNEKTLRKIREKAPVMTETYIAYGATQRMMKECARPGEYTIPQALEKDEEIPRDETGAHLGVSDGWWYTNLGLAPTFINWAQITFIHMYLLQVRFRMFPKTHAPIWIQHLTNHAFYLAEDRLVVWHKLNSNSLRQKYLKDLFSQWRAVLLSYDEGIVKGDAVLAAALWRNVFASREDMDFEKLAQLVGYMRRELQKLDMASDDQVAMGNWEFSGEPDLEASVVKLPSRMAAALPKA